MSKYAEGRRLEYKTMRVLEDQGFYVQRSAGSHGIWDLIAYQPGMIVFIQVKGFKNGKGDISFEEFNKMARFKVCANARKEIWFWREWGNQPEIRRIN